MKLQISHSFSATPGRVFAAVLDPSVLQRCIDGCEKMEKTGEDTYTVQLKVGIAGLKGSYTGKVQITEKRPPEALTLAIDGKGAPGFLKAIARMQLSAAGDRTQLSGEADATVGGLIAAIGSRLIEAAAKKMMGEFFARLEAEISARRAS
jgi:carbon monoxide dehydrogenase subunit G